MDIRKRNRRRSRSSNYAELGDLTQDGNEMYKDLQRTCTAIVKTGLRAEPFIGNLVLSAKLKM